MNCNCCGAEIDRVLVNVFLPDGSDKEALIQFSDNGEETYCLETDRNWTGYELCEEDQIETISDLYDVCIPILEECYDRMKKEREAEGEE